GAQRLHGLHATGSSPALTRAYRPPARPHPPHHPAAPPPRAPSARRDISPPAPARPRRSPPPSAPAGSRRSRRNGGSARRAPHALLSTTAPIPAGAGGRAASTASVSM